MKKRVLSLLFTITAGFSCSQSTNSLIANFSFNNGSARDEEKGFEAKLYNVAFVPDRFGNPNFACYIQGSNGSYINLGTLTALKPKVGSVSMWINIAHPILSGIGVESNPILFTKAHSGEDHNEAYYIGYDYATKNLNVNTTLSKEKQISIFSTKPFSIREWHHVVMVYDNNYLSFYIDGKLENKMPKNFESQFLEGDSILIGNRNSVKNQRFFNGSVDDVTFFNKTLSLEEVVSLYKAPDPNRSYVILKWISFIGGLLLLVIIFVWLIRRRITSVINQEKERNQILHHALEQEIKMLKAQMDPHFIFNSLNTILQFIITKENAKAELYLTKFAKLIRKLLESNTHESISLEDELDILKKYLEIESLRFDKVFEPFIEIGSGIDPPHTYIPHMLIQPFVENAIWHGLRLKEGEKLLRIRFELINEKTLLCVIDDNGIGRKKENLNTGFEKNRSLAINFIKQRLELMSRKYEMNYSVEIIDKYFENGQVDGTRIELKLPILKR